MPTRTLLPRRLARLLDGRHHRPAPAVTPTAAPVPRHVDPASPF